MSFADERNRKMRKALRSLLAAARDYQGSFANTDGEESSLTILANAEDLLTRRALEYADACR